MAHIGTIGDLSSSTENSIDDKSENVTFFKYSLQFIN